MLLITREIDYALRILRALSDGTQLSIQEICEKEATPKQFAYRIIKKLEKMDWITIFRGSEGGCRLNIDLNFVNLYQLIEGISSERDISECLDEKYICSRKAVCDDICNIRIELKKIQQAFNKELECHSIYSLIYGK